MDKKLKDDNFLPPEEKIYRVRFIQRITLFEKDIRAKDKKKAEEKAFGFMNKFDRDLYDETEVYEIDEEDIE